MESEDHEGLADELDHEAEQLARESRRLDDEIDQVRSDWEAKRRDPGVPGAAPPAEPESPAEPNEG